MTDTTDDNDTNEIDEGDQLSAEDKARKAAEARRAKILAKAGNRLDMVAGIAPAASEEEAAEEEGGEKKTSSSKAAKMAALRRRRFKKAAAAADETAKDSDDTDNNAKPPVAAVVEEEKPAEPKVEEPKVEEPKAEDITAVASEEVEEKTEGEDDEPKKKYMGVAKMRRKMIKERYAAQQEEDAAAEGDATTTEHVVPTTKKGKPKKIKIYYTLPIAMHVVVVFLLFLAGLEIGLQQAQIDYAPSDLTVHTTLAPQQELRLLTKISGLTSGSSSSTTKKDPQSMLESYTAPPEEEDEFQDHDTDKDSKPENIDPLFQVDLDKYTQGPGFIMMAGRFAVVCHRLNLSIFYYFPLSMLRRIQNMGLSLLQSPPMMCLVALAIRQFIGKFVLGAKLPDMEKDAKESKGDVLSMVKNFVTNFLLKAFPTAANLYDAWTHLRSDMYVVLCGLFVGIAWHHQFGFMLLAATDSSDKPVTTDPPGIGSDEL